jgi:hypothetical protein
MAETPLASLENPVVLLPMRTVMLGGPAQRIEDVATRASASLS